MTHPFLLAIDAAVRCVECGLPPSAKCDCHTPKDPVTLVCTGCRAELVVEREPDFFDFDRIETTCPACVPDA